MSVCGNTAFFSKVGDVFDAAPSCGLAVRNGANWPLNDGCIIVLHSSPDEGIAESVAVPAGSPVACVKAICKNASASRCADADEVSLASCASRAGGSCEAVCPDGGSALGRVSWEGGAWVKDDSAGAVSIEGFGTPAAANSAFALSDDAYVALGKRNESFMLEPLLDMDAFPSEEGNVGSAGNSEKLSLVLFAPRFSVKSPLYKFHV